MTYHFYWTFLVPIHCTIYSFSGHCDTCLMLDWLKEIKEIALVTKSQNCFRQVWKLKTDSYFAENLLSQNRIVWISVYIKLSINFLIGFFSLFYAANKEMNLYNYHTLEEIEKYLDQVNVHLIVVWLMTLIYGTSMTKYSENWRQSLVSKLNHFVN